MKRQVFPDSLDNLEEVREEIEKIKGSGGRKNHLENLHNLLSPNRSNGCDFLKPNQNQEKEI